MRTLSVGPCAASDGARSEAFNTIFKSSATLDALRARAVAERLLPHSTYEDGVPGRSLAWKVCKVLLQPMSVLSVCLAVCVSRSATIDTCIVCTIAG